MVEFIEQSLWSSSEHPLSFNDISDLLFQTRTSADKHHGTLVLYSTYTLLPRPALKIYSSSYKLVRPNTTA